VMIHGAFCGGWVFEQMAAFFRAEGYQVHCPTLVHHDAAPGDVPHPALGTVSLRDYERELSRLIDGLPEKPILFGHSMGGLLAQMLAARNKAAACVLFAPSPPWGVLPSSEHEVYSAMGMMMAGPFWSTQPLIPTFAIAADQALHLLPRADQKRVFSRFVPESGRATFEIMYWMMDFAQASYVNPARVKVPVLALGGGRDKVNPASTVRQIARRYRANCDFVCFDDHGHWLIGEPGWERLAQEALDWLAVRER